MSNPYNLKPGDWVYVARRNGTGAPEKIVKVGRKWATLDGDYRVNLETLEIDGQWSTIRERCYVSVEHYEQERKRLALWRQLREYVATFNPPASMTVERLEGILGALRPESPNVP